MNNEELVNAWAALQNRVEQTQRQIDRSEMEAHRKRLWRQPIWEIALASLTALSVGSFVGNHVSELLAKPLAAVPAAIVFTWAVAEINLGVRHLIVANEVDLARPIAEAQAKLAELRKLRVRMTQAVFLGALPVWVVLPLLLGQAAFGVDFLFAVNSLWIAVNVMFGLLMIPLVDWTMKRSRHSMSLQDAMVGKEIVDAEHFLRDIETFRAE